MILCSFYHAAIVLSPRFAPFKKYIRVARGAGFVVK
jgi:hypothetical protein